MKQNVAAILFFFILYSLIMKYWMEYSWAESLLRGFIVATLWGVLMYFFSWRKKGNVN